MDDVKCDMCDGVISGRVYKDRQLSLCRRCNTGKDFPVAERKIVLVDHSFVPSITNNLPEMSDHDRAILHLKALRQKYAEGTTENRIINYLKDKPGSSNDAIAQVLGASTQEIFFLLQAMCQRGELMKIKKDTVYPIYFIRSVEK